MASYSDANSLNQIVGRHAIYRQHHRRWKFLQDSYQGGSSYSKGGYLTRYVYESNDDYLNRVSQTPLDNHCKSIISIYNSFIFSKPPKRDFMSMSEDPILLDFLADADQDGRSWDSFMREVDVQASIFGHTWVIVDRPNVSLDTRADEIALNVRPYVCIYNPLTVVDWRYERNLYGRWTLEYLKVFLDAGINYEDYAHYYPDRVDICRSMNMGSSTEIISSTPNTLGYIPAVCVYSTRSNVKGIGISDINDIADLQRAIYDELSEIEQLIRISNHPSLVSTQEVQASAGAGARIIIPENQDAGLKPYLLQPTAQNLDGIRASIKDKIESINQIANVSSVRATQGRSISGVAMETEFRLMNSLLTQKADELELSEEQIFKMVFDWMGYPNQEFEIDYPESFNTKDRMGDLLYIQKAKEILAMPSSGNAVLDKYLNEQVIVEAIEDSDQQDEIIAAIESAATQPAISADTMPAGSAVSSAGADTCPVATQDIAVNLANRQTAIDTANYGPLNPALPNTVFWQAKADMWKTDVTTAKQSRCGNCSFFNQTTKILDCIDTGLAAGGATGSEWDSVGGGQLGYCEAFDFKCKSTRTCDAWVAGGPVTDSTPSQPGSPN